MHKRVVSSAIGHEKDGRQYDESRQARKQGGAAKGGPGMRIVLTAAGRRRG
jgi:hypothetical protein